MILFNSFRKRKNRNNVVINDSVHAINLADSYVFTLYATTFNSPDS